MSCVHVLAWRRDLELRALGGAMPQALALRSMASVLTRYGRAQRARTQRRYRQGPAMVGRGRNSFVLSPSGFDSSEAR